MAKNITKKDLVLDIADGSNLSRETIQGIVEAFLDFVKFHISKGQTIEIRGFGTFSLKRRKRRPARNPRTGEPVALLDRYAPSLRFSDSFRDLVAHKEIPPEG